MRQPFPGAKICGAKKIAQKGKNIAQESASAHLLCKNRDHFQEFSFLDSTCPRDALFSQLLWVGGFSRKSLPESVHKC